MKPILEIQNLSKQFRIYHEVLPYETLCYKLTHPHHFFRKKKSESFWALKNVSFEVAQGQSIGIIGRNGAGKSTLLKILSKISPPTEGKIISRGRIASLLEVGTGFHPELTGRENIFFNGSILGMKRTEIFKHFDEIVDFSGVEKFLDTPLKHYSSGMQLRLAFAVAAFLEPEILVIDEVLAVGDADFQKKCLDKIDDVTEKGRTILFVSHQMGTIARFCSQSILLREGKVVKFGNTTEVIDHYLNSGENSQGRYLVPADDKKDMMFTDIRLVGANDNTNDQFGFHEPVTIDLKVNISNPVPNVKVGIALLSKFDSRVFTIVKSLEELVDVRNGEHRLKVRLPGNLIAPNNYSFTCALFIPFGRIIDIQEGICRMRIVDTGTDLSVFEGVDYGNVIIQPEWI